MAIVSPQCTGTCVQLSPPGFQFVIYAVIPVFMRTLTIAWTSPQSGFVIVSSEPINFVHEVDYNGTITGYLDFPSGVNYCYFDNQAEWTINTDANGCYIYVTVYGPNTPRTFSLIADGQLLYVADIIQYNEEGLDYCPGEILFGLMINELAMNNGLIVAAYACTSIIDTSVGSTTMTLDGTFCCDAISFCNNCPTSGCAEDLYCYKPLCSIPKLLNLPILKAPAPKSTISSTLWNAIVNNIYSAYNSLLKIKTALSLANYANILNQIYAISDALYTPTPYAFTPLLTASKGVPLTAHDFNALVNALEQVYNELRKPLPYSISPAFSDAIVKSETFAKIVDNLNALRQQALQSVLLTSSTGAELNDLPANFAGQNVLVCTVTQPVILRGNIMIENLLINNVTSALGTTGNVSISRLIIQTVSGGLELAGTANIQNIQIGTLSGTLEITDFASVQNLFVNEISSGGKLMLSGNAYVQNLMVNSCSKGSIIVEDYAIVNNLNGMASQCISST